MWVSLNETMYVGALKDADFEFKKFFFLNSVPKVHILGKLSPKTLNGFVLNEIRYVRVFKGDGSKFDNCFLKSCSQNIIFGQAYLSFSS